jgi:hypothetical protein
MARTTEKDAIKFVRMVHSEHSSYWKDKAVELRKYKNSYNLTLVGLIRVFLNKTDAKVFDFASF